MGDEVLIGMGATVLDGAVVGKQTPDSVVNHVKGWLENGSDRTA